MADFTNPTFLKLTEPIKYGFGDAKQMNYVRAAPFDTGTVASTVAVNDRVFLTVLPPTARIVGGVVCVVSPLGASGTNGKLTSDIGDLTAANALNLGAASAFTIDTVSKGLLKDWGYQSTTTTGGARLWIAVQAVVTAAPNWRVCGVFFYV